MTQADTRSSPAAAALREAVGRHRAGRLDEAAALYAEVLAVDASNGDALHLSGVLAYQQGRHPDAISMISRAIQSKPSVPEFWHSRGLARRAIGHLDAAEADFRTASTLHPKYVEAWVNLGITRLQRDDPTGALAAFRQAAKLAPNSAEVQGYLGTTQLRLGALKPAIAALTRAVGLEPHFAEAHYNLGIAYDRSDDPAAAERAWRRSIEANPFYLKPWNNLGVLLHKQGRNAEARASFERALSHAGPEARDTAELWNNLGNVLDAVGQIASALDAFERAVALQPANVPFRLNFGTALLAVGRTNLAQAQFVTARDLDPKDATAAQCAAMGLLYVDHEPDAPLAAAAVWAQRVGAPPAAAFANGRDADRRLRIGYVSPDFCRHAVANFIEPVLAAHDPGTVEPFCYAEVRRPDDVTDRLRRSVGSAHWRDTVGLTDDEVAAAVRRDGIDILVDLAGHTVGSRLAVFARKPAPVQATWIGYPATTGLAQVDWRITDAWADPPDIVERQYSERLLRLPSGFSCYRPIDDGPAVAPLPADRNGHITFGCFNHAAKIREETLDLWAELLRRVPTARLCLKHRGFGVPAVAAAYRERFERSGVAASRVDLIGFIDEPQDHLAAYGRVDVALDTFPYHGTTTTCEALWMGVPVVTRAGATHMSRVGVSLLTRVGLTELIADTPAAYIEIAARLAADHPSLGALRQDLRARMGRSSLGDATFVTRDLEAAYRRLWRDWCRTA